VRQPGAALPFVDAEPLESELYALCEGRCPAAWVGEDEHADRARLAVPHGLEEELLGGSRLPVQDVDDPLELATRPRAEKGKGDVEALDGPAGREVRLAPSDELGDHVLRELEREEEPDPVIALDGTP